MTNGQKATLASRWNVTCLQCRTGKSLSRSQADEAKASGSTVVECARYPGRYHVIPTQPTEDEAG
jgi:hypothetical protein